MKKLCATLLAACSLTSAMEAEAKETKRQAVAPPEMRVVAPGLADYTDDVLFGDVWQRPDLVPRDRSMVTVSALIAGGHTEQMASHFRRALDNGVKPVELSGIITHLAFYSGWPRAVSAVKVAKDVFAQRNIPAMDNPLEKRPFDEAGDSKRAALVRQSVGGVAPVLANYTNDILFQDLWLRTDLAPRDRSLVTIAALVAAGQTDQMVFHLNKGLDNGLTKAEVSEVVTHLAFYAGWPRAMSAVPVVKGVFESRNAVTAPAATISVTRHGAQPPTIGSQNNFSGTVRVEGRFSGTAPARVSGGTVIFEPGARTAWHTHPLGQTLIVTAGIGRVQQWDGPVQEIRPGDVVWIPPGVKHWHGASIDQGMTHIAIAEMLDGKAAEWLEKVGDER